MGNQFQSTGEAKIDRPERNSTDILKCNILLLGTGGSGKSSTFRQIAKNLEELIHSDSKEQSKIKVPSDVIQSMLVSFILLSCSVLKEKKESFEKEISEKTYEELLKQGVDKMKAEEIRPYFNEILILVDDEKVRVCYLLYPKEFNFADEIH